MVGKKDLSLKSILGSTMLRCWQKSSDIENIDTEGAMFEISAWSIHKYCLKSVEVVVWNDVDIFQLPTIPTTAVTVVAVATLVDNFQPLLHFYLVPATGSCGSCTGWKRVDSDRMLELPFGRDMLRYCMQLLHSFSIVFVSLQYCICIASVLYLYGLAARSQTTWPGYSHHPLSHPSAPSFKLSTGVHCASTAAKVVPRWPLKTLPVVSHRTQL